MLSRRVLMFAILTALAFPAIPHDAKAEEVLKQGTFSGKSGHVTSGSVSVVKTDKGIEVRLGDTFKFDGAPGPYLGFGKSGKYIPKSEFSKLNSYTGAQVYKLPGGVDVKAFNEIYVWCKPFGVPLAVATLK